MLFRSCGIAVRHIAPYLKSKQTDPAVVVLDEKGNFAISLISGHIGGANELTKEIAAVIGATPVITTATDINGLFSVDKWAKENECFIDGINMVKDISSALLDDKKIGIYSYFKICTKLPKNVVQDMNLDIGFSISIYKDKPFNETLLLVPKKVTLGVGCKKGIPFENVERALLKILKENNISIKALKNIASIELKKGEKALNSLSQKYQLPFETYTAQQLSQLKGDFTSSDFVKQTTGVDNVCERAAVMGSENGRLILKKQAIDGVTIALAVSDWSVRFEE